MAKYVAALSLALCFVSFVLCFVGIALVYDSFTIYARLSCDTCRAAEFQTSLSDYNRGVVPLVMECKSNTTKQEVTLSKEEVVGDNRRYNVDIKGTETRICEVALHESARRDCSAVKEGKDRVRVVFSRDDDNYFNHRYKEPLGYLKDEPLP